MSRYLTTPSTVLEKIESGQATDDEFLEAANIIATMTAALRAVKERWEAAAITHLGDRAIESGGVRYYIGSKKTTRCRDQAELLRTLLETGGPDGVVKVLASSAFKHGAAKEVLGDEWGRHFEVVTEPELAEGKPARKLQSVDQRFLR